MPAPELLSPEDGQVFAEDEVIVLRWQSVGVLPSDAYYEITLAYSRLGETWHDDTPWTEDTSWALSEHDYLVGLSDDGQFQWSVQVVKQTGLDEDGKPKPKMSHTLNPVPFIVYDPLFQGEYRLAGVAKPGLSNIAATCIQLLGYRPPDDYDASLIAFV